MKRAVLFLPLLLTLLSWLVSCQDSEGLRASAGDADTLSLKVLFYKSGYGNGEGLDADTILAGDSLYFVAQILPSRSLGSSRYYWMVDTVEKAKSFNLRLGLEGGGRHRISFHLVDGYGDTLSDTAYVWVSHAPVCKSSVLPADHSWGTEAASVLFSWVCEDEDAGDRLNYRFRLWRQGDTLLDTALNVSSLQLPMFLAPLEAYAWSVEAQDNLGMKDTLKATHRFSTRGLSKEGALFATLNTPTGMDTLALALKCQGKDSSYTVNGSEGQRELRLSPMPQGSYSCRAYTPNWPDLRSTPQNVNVYAGSMRILPVFTLEDSLGPEALALDGDSLLPPLDTLRFLVRDGAPGRPRLAVYWNGTLIRGWSRKGDTLKVPRPLLLGTPGMQTLGLWMQDSAGNTGERYWTVSPAPDWISSLGDTLVQDYAGLYIPVCQTSGQFRPQTFFWDIEADGTIDHSFSPASDTTCASLYKSAANLGKRVRVGIEFRNGLQAFKTFSVTVNHAPGRPTQIAPANRDTVSRYAQLAWSAVKDADGDPVSYQVEYQLEEETLWHSLPESQDTTLSLGLWPQVAGTYAWRIRTRDNRGGETAPRELRYFTLEMP